MDEVVVRRPWLGERRGETNLLCLGESHYCHEGDDPADPGLTQRVVQEMAEGKRLRFFTAMERAVTGCARGQTNPASFFPTISFANFCQGCVDGSAGRPDKVMWQSGIDALPTLLKDVAPHRMLVFSKESRKRFSHLEAMSWQHVRNIEHDGYVQDTGFLISNDGGIRVYCMDVGHPASRDCGDPSWWHTLVTEFLSDPT